MTTKRNPKVEHYKSRKKFLKINGRSNPSQRITKRNKSG